MTIEDRIKRKKKKRIPFGETISIGVLLGVMLVFITPRCEENPSNVLISYSTNVDLPGLDHVIDSLSRHGYAIENHYPIYVRLYKPNIPGDEKIEAVRIAKAIKANTGTVVQVQLDFSGGRCFANPDKGIITTIVK